MVKLAGLGYWKERRGFGKNFPLPIRSKTPHPNKEKILSYLQSGLVFTQDLGYAYCRFRNGPKGKEMGSADLTDGIWLWPEGLAVYVSKYNVLLPDYFLDFLQRRDYLMPDLVNSDPIIDADIDFSSWVSWGKKNKPSFFERIVLYQQK